MCLFRFGDATAKPNLATGISFGVFTGRSESPQSGFRCLRCEPRRRSPTSPSWCSTMQPSAPASSWATAPPSKAWPERTTNTGRDPRRTVRTAWTRQEDEFPLQQFYDRVFRFIFSFPVCSCWPSKVWRHSVTQYCQRLLTASPPRSRFLLSDGVPKPLTLRPSIDPI